MIAVVTPDVRVVVGGAVCASGIETVVLGPLNLLRWPNKSFTVYNLSSITMSGAKIQTSPDQRGDEAGTASSDPAQRAPLPGPELWHNIDTLTFQSLESGGIRTVEFYNARRWWRVVAKNDVPSGASLTISGWCNASTI